MIGDICWKTVQGDGGLGDVGEEGEKENEIQCPTEQMKRDPLIPARRLPITPHIQSAVEKHEQKRRTEQTDQVVK